MGRNEISLHELKVFDFVSKSNAWVAANEIAESTGVAPRTARAHSLKLTKLGLFDVAEVFPAHRYRLSEKADKRNQGYWLRLEKAREVFAI
jgi:predicted ArsR family transcriptional regulator